MPARKRRYEEVEVSVPSTETPPLLKKLRNMWQFANLMEYINIFGDAVRINKDFDIEDLEAECLLPESSHKLAEIGLCLLKNVSSFRGLTPENFDEYTRRQYQAKKPTRNPFGDEESPVTFHGLDIFKKIQVLVDLSQWPLINANAIKEKILIPERDQAEEWRADPCGWDKHERIYFWFKDERLYRRTDPVLEPSTPPKPKAKSKPKSKPKRKPPTRGTRASGRLKVLDDFEDDAEDEDEPQTDADDTTMRDDAHNAQHDQDDEFGGMKWECVAVSLTDYQDFLATIQKSKDPDEKNLYKFLTTNIMPSIEAADEKRRQKVLRRQRELEAIQKLATAKRSTRIAGRRQHEAEEAEARAAEEKRQQDLADAQKMLLRDQQMEQDRESRRLTREQRIKERELRRVLEEEALNNLTAVEAQGEESDAEGRRSRRHLKVEIERKRKAVEELQPEDEWVFDCSGCGVHGANLDDGSHSVACDVCNVWQHSACLGITEAEAEKDDFHFVCRDCHRKQEEADRPKPPRIKLKLNPLSSSPPSAKKVKKEHPEDTHKVPRSKKQSVNGASSNGEWHNTFAYPQSPTYAGPTAGFVPFKPEKYYTNGTNGTHPQTHTPARPQDHPKMGVFTNSSPRSTLQQQSTTNGQQARSPQPLPNIPSLSSANGANGSSLPPMGTFGNRPQASAYPSISQAVPVAPMMPSSAATTSSAFQASKKLSDSSQMAGKSMTANSTANASFDLPGSTPIAQPTAAHLASTSVQVSGTVEVNGGSHPKVTSATQNGIQPGPVATAASPAIQDVGVAGVQPKQE